MKCKACNGTGKIKGIDFAKPDWKDTEKVCTICCGTGVIVQTNYDWLNSLPIEEQARFFSHEMRCEFCPNQEQCDSLGANCKVLWELWLKKPHHDEVEK